MRNYTRCLVCPECSCPCVIIGEHADTWECTFCDKTYPATPEEVECYTVMKEVGEKGRE